MESQTIPKNQVTSQKTVEVQTSLSSDDSQGRGRDDPDDAGDAYLVNSNTNDSFNATKSNNINHSKQVTQVVNKGKDEIGEPTKRKIRGSNIRGKAVRKTTG